MLFNHVKFAFRNILRNKVFSLINITGISISLAAFVLMALYIENEWSFDRFHAQAKNIYRLVDDKKTNALTQHSAASAGPVAPALLADFPEVKKAARLIQAESLVNYGDKLFEERNIFYADPSLFDVFDLTVTEGEGAGALVNVNSVVMTEKTAVKYFGKSGAVGKTLLLDKKPMKITGVVKDLPANSHFSFDMLISMATAEQKESGYNWLFSNWYSNNFYTYILLPQSYDPARLVGKLDAFADRQHANTKNTQHHYNLEKLTDIYLRSDRENQLGKTGNIRNLYVFSAVAIFILLLACINFINLSTARASERAKEVAIKKVNGVSRQQLVLQFFVESFLMTIIAMSAALLLARFALPAFNIFAGTDIQLQVLSIPHLSAIVAITVLVGILSGGYPALILSRFNPVTALKGTIPSSASNILIRKGLVVFQFTVSIVLIIGSIVVYQQLDFMQRHDLGFTPAQTVVVNFEGDDIVQGKYQHIKERLGNIKGVTGVSASSNVPGIAEPSGWSMDIARENGDTIHSEMPIFLADFSFMRQFGLQSVAGRLLSADFGPDSTESMIINEAAVKKLGFRKPEDAIGLTVDMYPSPSRIVGVYKDFHYESLQKEIGPLAMRMMPNKFRVFAIAIHTPDVKQCLADIEKIWKELVPGRPFEYIFLDEKFNNLYKAENKFGQLFAMFTGLAISIACFGLFGLALFSVKQRRKEIGIRKVIGASVTQITVLLSKDFLALVALAVLLASPIALYIMHNWLQAFAYRAPIGFWMFASGGLLAIVVAIATIGTQAIKAATANPALSLRNE